MPWIPILLMPKGPLTPLTLVALIIAIVYMLRYLKNFDELP